MTTLQTVLRHLRTSSGAQAGAKDGQLLEQFVAYHDEAAFAVLVQRHGRMVYGVCMRILRNTHDVEDAFQATFMILARRAASILPRENVANWLHGVAYRTALKARMLMAKRGNKERELGKRAALQTPEERLWQDVLPLLDQELSNLPETYRIPIVLCDLEGKTRRDAAQQLGWPEGTVAGRLARGRTLLAKRLTRRGVLPSAALLSGGLLAEYAGAANVPPALVQTTIHTALAFAAGAGARATNGFIPAKLTALSRGVFRTMLISKLKKTVALLLVAALLITAVGLGARQVLAEVAAVDAEAVPVIAQDAAPAPTLAKVVPPSEDTHRLGSTRFRHGDTVFFVAYVAGGKQLVTAGHDLTIRLWEATSGKEIRRFHRPEGAAPKDSGAEDKPAMPAGMMSMSVDGMPQAAFPVAVSPDGQYVAALAGASVCVWDIATGKRLHTLKAPAPQAGQLKGAIPILQLGIQSLGFSGDGKRLLAPMPGNRILSWDVATGKSLGDAAADVVMSAGGSTSVISADGKYLAWTDFNLPQQSMNIRVKDLTTGKEVAEIKASPGDAKNLAFAPDGKTLAWTLIRDGIQLFEIGTDAEPRTIGKQGQRFKRITSFCFSPDGSMVALSAGDRTIQLWDVKADKLLKEFGESESPASGRRVFIVAIGESSIRNDDLAFSPDGKTLAAGLGGNVVRQFDTATGKEIALAENGHSRTVSGLQLGRNGTTLTTAAARDSVRLWDLSRSHEIAKLPLTVQSNCFALSPDGTRAYVAQGGTVELWDIASGKRVEGFKLDKILLATLTLSPDGKTLAGRTLDGGRILLWDAATGKALPGLDDEPPPAPGAVAAVLTERTGVTTGEIVFSLDGRYIAGADATRRLCLWDRATGARLWDNAVPLAHVVQRFAFSADSHTLAVLHADSTVSLVETSSGQKRATLGQPRTPVGRGNAMFVVAGLPQSFDEGPHTLAFSPDGCHLATSHAEPGTHLWDLRTTKEIETLMGHQGGVTALAFTADGQRLISGSVDTTTVVWDIGKKLKAPPAVGALDAAVLKTLTADLTGKDAAKAYDALRQLSRHPAEALAIVRDLVKPIAAPDKEQIDKLIANLASSKFDVRRHASTQLEKLGDVIMPALKEAHAREVSLEGKQRMELLFKKLSNPATSGTVVRDLRAVELLESVASPQARQLLQALAGGATGARLTQEARAALERLTQRP
jgi:RNA polymerase sigma factor (sigma-70 family)